MAQVEITILGATDVEVHRVDAPVAELLKLRSENKALADELVDATDRLIVVERELASSKREIAAYQLGSLRAADPHAAQS